MGGCESCQMDDPYNQTNDKAFVGFSRLESGRYTQNEVKKQT